MGKAVQYLFVGAESVNCLSVVFLVQEKSGLLSVFHIHDVTDTIFCDFNLCGERVADEAFEAFHAFLQAYLCIAALIDTTDHDTILCQHLFHKRKDRRLQTVDPKRQGFHHQHVGELVHHNARQEIGLPED